MSRHITIALSASMKGNLNTAFCALLALLAHSAMAEYVCDSEGMHADPENCQNFIYCLWKPGPDGELSLHPVYETCPDTELFDDVLFICNYDYLVDCGDRPGPDGNTGHTTGETQPTLPTTSAWTTQTGPTTTSGPPPTTNEPPPNRFPTKVMAFYLTLADDTVDGFGTDDDWNPELFEYQQVGSNLLFFSFINPENMKVPKSFEKLAKTRGTGAPGAVPADTKILFAVGGLVYSEQIIPWPWLASQAAAEAMAAEVAQWPSLYGCDGIDLDIETGAGDHPDAGRNLIHFIKTLRQLAPNIIVGQPTFGYPQVKAEIDVINESWNVDTSSNNLADSVGLMVYEGTESLRYVENFAHGSEQWEGFPITVNVPYNAIMAGSKGCNSPGSINTIAQAVMNQNLLGMMVWYASVQNGFEYAGNQDWNASNCPDSQAAYVAALQLFLSKNR